MTSPSTTREALIVESLGEAARLMQRIEALAPVLDASSKALADARLEFFSELASFEARVFALAEQARVQTAKHILAHADQAARRAAELEARAMADAARVAFTAQIGAAVQRLHAAMRMAPPRPVRRWDRWLTHAVTAIVASCCSSVGTVWFLMR